MAVTASLRVLFVKLSFLFLEAAIMKLVRASTNPSSAFCFNVFMSFLNSSSAGMLARAEYRSGFGHVFLFKWSFSFLMDSSVFLILASVVVGILSAAFLLMPVFFCSLC